MVHALRRIVIEFRADGLVDLTRERKDTGERLTGLRDLEEALAMVYRVAPTLRRRRVTTLTTSPQMELCFTAEVPMATKTKKKTGAKPKTKSVKGNAPKLGKSITKNAKTKKK